MLSEREKQPEMDCQTHSEKESSTKIQCSSDPAKTHLSSGSNSPEIPQEDSHFNAPNFKSKFGVAGVPPLRTGRWTPDEKILFLYGLKMFGKGRWKKMSVYLPQRSLVQIKSHAQKVLKRQQAGENIFRRLEENYDEIDNLVVQAARQRDALRMSGMNVNTPATKPNKNLVKTATKKKNLDVQISATEDMSPTYTHDLLEQSSTTTKIPANQSSDSSVLAAAALCQLSSIGGTWDQRESSTVIGGKG